MSRLQTSFVLGYHGCDKSVGMKIVNGQAFFTPSHEEYDWLGGGIYFWENDPARAREWAEQKVRIGAYREPFVVGAVIDLANCLDLRTLEDAVLVKDFHTAFCRAQKKAGLPIPKNKNPKNQHGRDLVMRYLDCAVINYLHSLVDTKSPHARFDTVRALFWEGKPLYPGSGFKAKTHTQIAVRTDDCIKGVFIPRQI